MRRHVPDLAEQVLVSLRRSENAYRSGAIPPQEPPQWIAQSIHRALDALPMPPAEISETFDMPRRTGSRRARQGVPQRALLRAYHDGGRVLSTACMQWAFEEGLHPQKSVSLVESVWRIADEHSVIAVDALRSAQQDVTDRRWAGFLLDTLLNGDVDESSAATVARAFALPERGRYAVIVRQPAPGGPPARMEDLVPFADGMRVIWRMHGERAVGVAVLGEGEPTGLGGALSGGDFRTGISAAATGLASLGRARTQAEVAARTLHGAGLAFLEERLPVAMLSADPALARELQVQVLAPVLALEAGRRDLLLETLEAWLVADGLVAKVAADLHCHRNTVLNRLRRIEELTGRSLSSPRAVIDLGLALEAFRHFGGPDDLGRVVRRVG
ncbi:PucR family transcriptional regulator [Actinomadura rugatobispora]|uniref:PucR family transcriptional regulator n=1 Tax=Actinomadura rugatobispora TaxID=1994 RepID=A0ABW1A7C7_9ACTN|nr:helix-turn-helix domain-containing protein [Actinomadura rugatobispora]